MQLQGDEVGFIFKDYYYQYNVYYKSSSIVKIILKKFFEQINALEY